MSVVNRMLLDIDRRHGRADVPAQGQPHRDIRSVPPAAKPAARNNVKVVVLLVATVVSLAVLLGYYGLSGRADSPPAKPATPATPAAVPPQALQASSPPPASPAPEASPALQASLKLQASPVLETPPLPASPDNEVAAASPKPESVAPKPTVRARGAIESFKLSRELSPIEDRPAPPAAVTVSSAPARPGLAIRQVAPDETVAAARALWSDGSRAGALATLRDALAAAEAARNSAAVAPIARELARLEVGGNRSQTALDLLLRFEGLLAGDAEAWALRGNAEQRLALHADASRSYLTALGLRPVEGRWMLGAAISLAAEGRVDEARSWAERARERGAMTPAIESYLQQLGIIPPVASRP